ncbi:MAG: alpha/beta fold hydrolase [Pseudomonadota bacterium]
MRLLLKIVVAFVAVAFVGLAAAIMWPVDRPSAAKASVNAPFANVDFSSLPTQRNFPASDGTNIAFRAYEAMQPAVVALLLHGSSSHGRSMHALAEALRAKGITAYAIDIRGHGDSGRRGDVDAIGQPAEDVRAFLSWIGKRHPDVPRTLVGFSLGGGLALNAAGEKKPTGIDKLVLLAPMLGPTALPSVMPNPHRSGDRWAFPHLPRIIALSILNSVGITGLNFLPTIQYAVGDIEGLTGTYSYRLMMSLLPSDFAALLTGVDVPVEIIVGQKDEVFVARGYEQAVGPVRADISVRVLPDLNHIELILDPMGHTAIAEAVLATPR